MKPNILFDAGTLLDGLRRDLRDLPMYQDDHWSLSVENQQHLELDAIGELHLKGSKTPVRWGVEIRARSLEPRDAELLGARLAEMKLEQQLDGMLVLAPYVSEAAAESLERRGIGY